ncbi:MAG TPA: cupin-like domain-containing protein [Sphingomicrobium sp.]|nr:cupin-like domain-containing protein [Sphingomicrobium sp.]
MRPIAEYHGINEESFHQKIRPASEPAVFRGLAEHWPAVQAARRSDEDLVAYMKSFRLDRPVAVIVGEPEIEGRFLYTEDLRSLNFTRGMSPLDPFLDRLLRDRENPRPYAIAVQSEEVPSLLPGFEEENRTGLLDSTIVPRAWIGNRIQVAPHYDLMENLGIVVAGRRRFVLFPPDELKNLYVGPLELTPAGTPVSLVDPHNPDIERFPKFSDALRRAQVAELGPGDAIYIPFHWWHGVDSLEPVNLFINYWWNDARAGAGNPYDALLHAVYAIKTLPQDQRAVWRMVFDHYIFGMNGDPVEHLPDYARGMLGETTSEQLTRMRATLRQLLGRE